METVSLGLKKRNKRQRNDAISLNKNKRRFTKRCLIASTRVIILLVSFVTIAQLDCYFCFLFPLFSWARVHALMQYKQQRRFVFYFYALHFFCSIIRILLTERFFLIFIQKVYFFKTLSVTKWAKTHRNHPHNYTECSEETTATTPALLFQLLFYH